MPDFILTGNYLSPEGSPVVATRNDCRGPNIVGGQATAQAWLCRWVAAVSPAATDVRAHHEGAIIWQHGRSRHILSPGKWVVWDSVAFRVVGPFHFERDYDPVPVRLSTEAHDA